MCHRRNEVAGWKTGSMPSLQYMLVRIDFLRRPDEDNSIYLLVNIHDIPQRSRLGCENASNREILHDESNHLVLSVKVRRAS